MDLAGLISASQRVGPIAHLATTTPGGQPHVVPVHLDWFDDRLYCMAGRTDVKARNIAHRPDLCIHYQVGEATGWDSLMIWGSGRILDGVDDKRRLWAGVFSYDLDQFAPGGPEGSPDTHFIEVTPQRALLLRRYGFDGREEWRARV